jgi:hypothetical protein
MDQHPNDTCEEAQAAAMRSLLEKVGETGTCRGCNAPIFWVRHSNGKNVPYTPSGLNHFIDCEAREKFGKNAAKPAKT